MRPLGAQTGERGGNRPVNRPFLAKYHLDRVLIGALFSADDLADALARMMRFDFAGDAAAFSEGTIGCQEIDLRSALGTFTIKGFAGDRYEIRATIAGDSGRTLRYLRAFFKAFGGPCFRFRNVAQARKECILLRLLLFGLLGGITRGLVSCPKWASVSKTCTVPSYLYYYYTYSILGSTDGLTYSSIETEFSEDSNLLDRMQPDSYFGHRQHVST